MKLADFGLAIEVQGDQQAWFGKKFKLILDAVLYVDAIRYHVARIKLHICRR